MTGKERCMAAIRGASVDHTPIFPLLMFFAQERLGVTYRQFATEGHIAAEAQLSMLETFDIDAITACTDAFRLAADLGAEMAFPDDRPPYATAPLLTSSADLASLPVPDPTAPGSRMADRCLACSAMAHSAGDRALVLGWVDMPFAEACSLCGISEFMVMLYDAPALAHQILETLTARVIDFSLAQLEAGAHGVGAGDAASSLVCPDHYREFALPYERRIIDAVHAEGGLVKLHICGDTRALLADMASTGADLINVDHLVPMSQARDVFGAAGVCFKGNLDPVADILQATPERCRQRALECIRTAAGTSYMLSAGCEIPADTPDEVFTAFCQAGIEG